MLVGECNNPDNLLGDTIRLDFIRVHAGFHLDYDNLCKIVVFGECHAEPSLIT